jgi:hypothetical protein
MFSFFIGKEKQEKEHKTENKKVIFSLLPLLKNGVISNGLFRCK